MSLSATAARSVSAGAIRPYRIEVRREEIDELRRRVQATRWPDQETVSDRSQGVQLAKLRPTNTGASSSRSYWEGAQAGGGPFNAVDIPAVPVAVTVFPAEIYRAPRSWGERTFGNLIYWNEVDRGGHFAAWEQPELLAREIRAAFRSLRAATHDHGGHRE